MTTNSDNKSNMPALITAVMDAMRIPDLRNKILFTFGILVVFRFLAHVPVPGVDRDALAAAFDSAPLLGFLDLFSGGALRNLSIAALGVYPYITASIIMQVITPVFPSLKELSQEGQFGRQKINQYTHYLMIPIAFLRRPNGSFSPVGISLIENKSISVVNLSAIESNRPNSSLGNESFENLGL